MDKAHIQTEQQLKALEKELKKIYKGTLLEVLDACRAQYKQLKEEDTAEARKELKRLETLLRKVSVEATKTNGLAMEMLQTQLGKVVDINNTFAYAQILDIFEAEGLSMSYNLLDRAAIAVILKGDAFKEVAIDAFEDKARIYTGLRRAMAQSLITGEGADKMSSRIQKVMENEYFEAMRIARTETTKAQNSSRDAHYKQAQELGIEIKKKWVATKDERTRDSHKALDGKIIDYDKEFKNGCKFPGVGPGKEVINCRCTFTAVFDEED